MKLYHYVSMGCIVGIMGTLHATPPVRDRRPGDEREFEATHILWQQHDTYDTRRELINTQFNNERVYLRSGSISGYENAYEALLEVRENIKEGNGRFYQPHTKGWGGKGRGH